MAEPTCCGECVYFKDGECYAHPPVVMASTLYGESRFVRPTVDTADCACAECD